MARLVAVILALSFLPELADARPRQRGVGRHGRWQEPSCAGTLPGLTFVRNETISAAADIESQQEPRASDVQPTTGVFDIAVGPLPNQLFAIFDFELFESRNAGCTWTFRAHLAGDDYVAWLEATHASRVYAYSQERLVAITGSTAVSFAFPERIQRMFADRADALHLRAVAVYGAAWESRDGGATWELLGHATTQRLVNASAIDPANFDHLLVLTTEHSPLMASFDGGRTWTRTAMPSIYGWTVEFSPADSRVVWATGWDRANSQNPIEAIYRSLDGGMTWQGVVTEKQGFQFNRALLAPNPTNPAAVAFTTLDGVAVFDGQLKVVAHKPWQRPLAVTWSPAGTIYYSVPVPIEPAE